MVNNLLSLFSLLILFTTFQKTTIIVLIIIIIILAFVILYLLLKKLNKHKINEKVVSSVSNETSKIVDNELFQEELVKESVVKMDTETEVIKSVPLVDNTDIKFNYSLEAYIRLAPEEALVRYLLIKNHILSYPSVQISNSWKFQRFKYGARTLAKITLQGKTLRIYFDLDPNDYIDTVYKLSDESQKKNHELTPSMLKVRGNRGVKHAIELIDIYFHKLGITRNDDIELVIPKYETTKEELIELKLIKVKETKKKYDGTEI